MSMVNEWSIPGAEGQPILGNTHRPAAGPQGVVLIAHGFKGYKDYGMFPRIAETLAAEGFIAHRFNFSHSGMTNEIATFARPDLFEQDTWNKQVFDCRAVIDALAAGTLQGKGLAYAIFGHSRGGATALLTAGRYADDATFVGPCGIACASAPSTLSNLSPAQHTQLLTEGFLETPSARTGQTLRMSRAFLTEQLAHPAAHDLIALARRITCPVLLLHGTEDPTVPAACSRQLAAAIGATATVKLIAGGNHVFNTPNPLPADAESSTQLKELITALTEFAGSVC